MASITKRPDGPWPARYSDAAGREHARHFDLQRDGQRWLDQVTATLVTEQYVNPKAGAVTVAEHAVYRAVVVLAGTGVRISEALGLKVRDVDFLRKTLRGAAAGRADE